MNFRSIEKRLSTLEEKSQEGQEGPQARPFPVEFVEVFGLSPEEEERKIREAWERVEAIEAQEPNAFPPHGARLIIVRCQEPRPGVDYGRDLDELP